MNEQFERRVSATGEAALRWSLVLFFVGFGLLKFTAGEANAIAPLVTHSPFLFWLAALSGVQGASNVIGVTELLMRLSIALRHVRPIVSAYGSLVTAGALLVTLSFLFTNYVVRGLFDRHLLAQGRDWQVRSDFTYEPDIPVISALDAGFRYTARKSQFDAGQRYSPQEANGIPLGNYPLSIEPINGGFAGSDAQAFRSWIEPTYDSLRGNIAQLRSLVGFAPGSPPNDPAQDFRATELTYTGYVQARYKFNAIVPIDGTLGVRIADTDDTITGSTFVPGVNGALPAFVTQTGKNNYVDFLPSLNARAALKDDLYFRFAVGQSRTRPDFAQLNPNFSVPPNVGTSGRYEVTTGNANLQPFTSNNYDAIVEYYPSPGDSASFGIFRRDIQNFIVNQTADVNQPSLGQFGALRLTRPINQSAARIQGVEAQVTKFLNYDFVPAWARGFGLELNTTYLDGQTLTNISKWDYNIIGIYEAGPVSFRVAYNDRSRYTDSVTNTYVDDTSRLDFSASYTPIKNLTVTFNAENVLGKPFRNSDTAATGGYNYPRDVRYEESIYYLGLRFRY